MNGKLNRTSRLAVSLLGGFCLAAASFSTLAAQPTQISVTVNPTTGYFESTARTIVPPTNATISPVKDVSATVVSRLPNGALAQPISNGIEITALKQQQLVKSSVVAKPSALRRAGASCFKGGKCNAALLIGAVGLEYLLDSVDWVMHEGAAVRYKVDPLGTVPAPEGSTSQSAQVWTGRASCDIPSIAPSGSYLIGCRPVYNQFTVTTCRPGPLVGTIYTGTSQPSFCFYSPVFPPLENRVTITPVPNEEITQSFDAYDPHPSDWRYLVPGLNLGDPDLDIEITDAPRLTTPPITTTHYDASGNPVTVSETNTWYDFAPKNNPSKQPELEAQKTETKTEYDAGGNPKGSTTTTVVNPPSSAPQLPETPIDCDLMPTLCEWMLWTKEPPPEGDEPDFEDIRQVIDLRDYQQTVTIGPATLACPEPHQIEIGFIGRSVGVSFQPFCDLADYVRPLLLMFAYFFGAYLTIRSI